MRILIFTLFMSFFMTNLSMAENLQIGDFEDQAMGGWSAWAPATAAIAVNPAVDLVNPSAFVLKFDQTAEAWKGVARWFNTPVISKVYAKVALDVYIVDNTGLVQLYMDNSASGAPNSTDKQATGIPANTWTRIEFDVTDLAVLDFKQIAFQSDVKGILYLDNITLIAAEVEEEEPAAGVEWNISSDEFNALGTISENTTVNGLTIYATSSKTVVVDANNKSVNEMSFTHRMKLGGAGTVTDGVPSERVVSFDVEGNATITIAAMSSSGSEDRELVILTAAGDTVDVYPALGASLTMTEYEYEGAATTIYLFSKSSGINIYYLKVVEEEVVPNIPAPSDPLAIFDPATVDPSTLADGMEIVEIGGKKWLQVVVNEWNSIIDVPAFEFTPGMTAFAEFKYVVAQDQYPVAQINGAVQLIDTINLMKPSWSNDSVASTTGIIQSAPSGKFVKASAGAAATMKVVHQVQFFGQQTVSWGAVAGDTLWVGKVRAYTVEDDVIFDPATYDPDNLKAGMEYVEIGGKKYLQVVVDAWNSIIDVPKFKFEPGMTAFAEFKYVVAQDQYPKAQINATVQLIDTINLMKPSWSNDSVASTTGLVQSNPSGVFVQSSAMAASTMKLVHQVQFFGQQTVSWGAVAGDTLWVGKVTARVVIPPDPNVILDPATFDGALGTGWEIVTVDGTKYFKVTLDGWNSWMNIPAYTFPAGKNAFKASVKYEAGTSGAALDGLGAFLKFSTAGWSEIGARRSPITTSFNEQVVTMANNEGNIAGVFQVAVQDANAGYNAIAGDYLYIGKIMAITTAPVTFVVDDTKDKQYDGFVIRGSWKTNSGIYDAEWNGGVDHAAFTDSVLVDAENEVWEVDNIWEYTINLVADGGANVWKWGFLDLDGNWMVKGPDVEFSVNDWTPVTTTYVIGGTDVNELSAKLKIYPNPTSGILNISGIEAKLIEVFNLSGSKVFANTLSENRIDVSGLAKGSYLVKVTGNKGEVAVSKFNKN